MTSAPALSMTAWLLLLVLSVLWGGSFFFVGVAVKEMTPLTIVAGRVGLAAFRVEGDVGLHLSVDHQLRTVALDDACRSRCRRWGGKQAQSPVLQVVRAAWRSVV